MGEKETAEATPAGRTRAGNTVALDDTQGTVRAAEAGPEAAGDAEKTVQWEPHKALGLDVPEQERAAGGAESTKSDAGDAALKTRHDTVKNSIGNIR